MIAAVAQFLLAAGVIAFAGTFLTRSVDTIAEQTGLGKLLVGLRSKNGRLFARDEEPGNDDG